MSVASHIVDAAKIGGHEGHIKSLCFFATENLGVIAQRAQRLRDSGYSKARIQWIWAYRRVQAQLAVKKITAKYETFLLKYEWNNDIRKFQLIASK